MRAEPGSELARARIELHNAFDALWQFGGMRRGDAYAWLALELGWPRPRAHIGEMDLDDCAVALAAVRRFPGHDAALYLVRWARRHGVMEESTRYAPPGGEMRWWDGDDSAADTDRWDRED